VALVEVFLERQSAASALLQGEVMESSRADWSSETRDEEQEELEGNLVLVRDHEAQPSGGRDEDNTHQQEPWIGVVPVEMDDSKTSTGNQESFADAVVNRVLSKPIIVIQTSENVTKLIGALLSHAHPVVQLRPIERRSVRRKYLQQLWDTVLLVALILCTGVIVQARWQFQDHQLNDNLELLPKQDVLKRMSSLKTKTYRQPKPWCDPTQQTETENCAVCLEPFNNNQCLRVLPCLHEYHRECIDPWLLLQHTCPLCKRSILSEFTPPHLITDLLLWLKCFCFLLLSNFLQAASAETVNSRFPSCRPHPNSSSFQLWILGADLTFRQQPISLILADMRWWYKLSVMK
ncbi:hypothetical protein GOODEAATRI_014575, partial [Goodea atripinnis]